MKALITVLHLFSINLLLWHHCYISMVTCLILSYRLISASVAITIDISSAKNTLQIAFIASGRSLMNSKNILKNLTRISAELRSQLPARQNLNSWSKHTLCYADRTSKNRPRIPIAENFSSTKYRPILSKVCYIDQRKQKKNIIVQIFINVLINHIQPSLNWSARIKPMLLNRDGIVL